MSNTEQAYQIAKARYADFGVNTDDVMNRLKQVSISMHCWQGDDVVGYESTGDISEGGIMATGNYPGRARTPDELRSDIEKAMALIPGSHRFSLHACYAESEGKSVDRSELTPDQFRNWISWAQQMGIGLDFNPTCFAHPKASSGFTLGSHDPSIRQYWIDHCISCRHIGAEMGRVLGKPCITNIWIPDGYKDLPADRSTPREYLVQSLDKILEQPINPDYNRDAVECKLFGIGSESYVAGSHEFYLGYAVKNQLVLCLDAGHFHPTEEISDKISSTLLFVPELLLHVSRGVRWDSDHVVIMSDPLQNIAHEIVRGAYLDRVHVGLDFFDASINRVAAWVIGTRSTIKALLFAMLEPTEKLKEYELAEDFTSRLALMEEMKSMPYQAVWEQYCISQNVPESWGWMQEIKAYEENVLVHRN